VSQFSISAVTVFEPLVPAEAGTRLLALPSGLDSRFRGNERGLCEGMFKA
jgi:hypothetical protein